MKMSFGAACAACMFLVAGSMPAQARPSSAHVARKAHGMVRTVAHASSDAAPIARIRGAQADGLTPLKFAYWLRRHPDVAVAQADTHYQLVASRTGLLNRTSTDFAKADRNDDGRVSARELADFVMRGGVVGEGAI